MFDIGFTELILLAGLGLIVLGPQRLPKVAAQLGRWVGQARRMSRTLMYQLRQEVNLDDPRPFSTRRTAQSSGGAKANTAHEKKSGGTGSAPNSKAAGDEKEESRNEEEAAGDKNATAGGEDETAGSKQNAARRNRESRDNTAQTHAADGAGVSQSGG